MIPCNYDVGDFGCNFFDVNAYLPVLFIYFELLSSSRAESCGGLLRKGATSIERCEKNGKRGALSYLCTVKNV